MPGPRTAAQIAATYRLDHLVSEKDFMATVVEVAQWHGWWIHHHYDARRSSAGWPDLVLLRPPAALFVELKREDGKVTAEQAHVLELLEACGLRVAVWRPSQLDDVIEQLGRGET